MATEKQIENALERTVKTAEKVANVIKLADAEKCPNPEPPAVPAKEPEPLTLCGACRFCGQARQVEGCSSEDEANEYATRHCACLDARAYQDEIEAQERRAEGLRRISDNLENLFKGMEPETMEILKSAAELIYDRGIVSITVRLSYMISAKIGRNAKGNIVIERKDAAAQKVEV